jgi:hypothetical protein
MPENLFENLPQTLKSVRTRPLFVIRLEVKKPMAFGTTPAGKRHVAVISGGAFNGERLSGRVQDGGGDWLTVRSDGATTLNVRLTLETTEGDLICMIYQGLRCGPPEVMEKLEKGETVDPANYYFRITPLFETSSIKYDWLNRVLAVRIGHRPPGGPVYSIFEVL